MTNFKAGSCMIKKISSLVFIALITLITTGCASNSSNYRIKSDGVYWYQPASTFRKERLDEIIQADKKTFKPFKSNLDFLDLYGIDQNHIYYTGIPIAFSDPESFQLLNIDYAVDKNYVYYMGRRIFGILSKNFTQLEGSGRYGKATDKGVHYGKIFTLCDPDTFRPRKDSVVLWSLDDKCVYFEGKVFPNIDRGSFTWLNSWFTKDKNRVYYKDKILIDADPQTFHLTKTKGSKSSVYAKDALRCWNKNGKIIDCNSEKEISNQKSFANMSQSEIDKWAVNLGYNLFKSDQKSKKAVLSKHEETIKSILEQNKKKILTPQDVSNINLTSISNNFSVTLESNVNKTFEHPRRTTYTLKKSGNDKIYFDVFDSRMKGVITEIRGLKGHFIKEAIPAKYLSKEQDYKSSSCRFIVGKCTETYQSYYPRSKEHSKIYTNDIMTQYKDGVWIRSVKTKGDIYQIVDKSIYDKNGFPLYRITFSGSSFQDEIIAIK